MTTLTPGRATADAFAALSEAGIVPQRVTSTDMGYQDFLGGHVIETEARVTRDDLAAAAAALETLPGAKGCECMHACACVYRLAGAA
jgi:hypothetical protein